MIALTRNCAPFLFAVLVLAPGTVHGQPSKPAWKDEAAVKALAVKIDERFAKHWKDKKVQPAPQADDAEFMRRVYLDLIGRIPSAGEARQFLSDKSPDKRRRLVDMLLDHPRYTVHWMNYWEALLLPE